MKKSTPVKRTLVERSALIKRSTLMIGLFASTLLASSLTVSILMPTKAIAQAKPDWPTKTVRIIVAFAAGGTSDVTARLLSDSLTRKLGQTFIVENRTGAGGAIASDLTLQAEGDGHTLLVTSDSALFQAVSRTDARTYSEVLKPIAVLTSQPIVLVANPSAGVTTVSALIAKAKAASAPMPYATATATGSQRVVAEAFFKQAGVTLQNVPYKGGGQAVQDLVSGTVAVGMLGTAPLMAPLRSGKLTAVAVTSAKRSASLPDVPTIAESGFAGFDMTQWFALAAPASISDALVKTIAAATLEALSDKGLQASLEKAGLEATGEGPATFAARLAREKPVWQEAAKMLGVETR